MCVHCASPLDDIIDKLGGPSQVAEMTGRQGRIVRTARGLKYEVREICPGTGMESLNIKEVVFHVLMCTHNMHDGYSYVLAPFN